MVTSFKILLILLLSFSFTACGKRGDLLPPPGYETPNENN
mgnify:CR=1 FL=1